MLFAAPPDYWRSPAPEGQVLCNRVPDLGRALPMTANGRSRPRMCGIFGYVGDREAGGFILDGLRRVEYRGYDSAGHRGR